MVGTSNQRVPVAWPLISPRDEASDMRQEADRRGPGGHGTEPLENDGK